MLTGLLISVNLSILYCVLTIATVTTCIIILVYVLHEMCEIYSINQYQYYLIYRIRSLFGDDFNLAVWRFFIRPPI